VYKKIASFVLFLGLTAALAGEPPAAPPEPLARPPVAEDAPSPEVRGVPLPPIGSAELPPPRPVPPDDAAPAPPARSLPDATPRPQPMPQLFKMAPATPSRDVETLKSELDQLRQENERMLKGRRGLAPSGVGRPAPEGGPESSLELRLRLADKLAHLRKLREEARADAPPAPPAVAPGSTPSPEAPVPPSTSSAAAPPPTIPTQEEKESPVDAPGLGRVLFLSGDYAKALATYTAIDPAEQIPEDRLVRQYMMACCLRKTGKLDEAAALYREVGNSGGHESLVTNAQWHLQTMKGHQELVAELARLRALREALTRRAE
jgi:hypothetical protein